VCWSRETAIIERNVIATFYIPKFPRQCTIILLVKVVWRPGEVLRSGEGKVTGSGLFWVRMRGKSLSSTVLCPNFHINILEGCILLNFILAFRELHSVFWHHNSEVCTGAKFACNIEISAQESCSRTWNLCSNSSFTLYPRKIPENLDWIGWPQDLLDAYWPSASSLAFQYASPSGHPCVCSCLNKRC
jgi:hypothetical protein